MTTGFSSARAGARAIGLGGAIVLTCSGGSACSAAPERGTGFTAGPALGTGDAGDDDVGKGAADDDDDDAGFDDSTGADGLPTFDLGAPAGDGFMPQDGCTKIDFLFVIDNSRSMQGKQEALATTFEPFMQAIEQTLTTDDVHVMVVDTDAATLCTPQGCANPTNPVIKHCIDGEQTDNGYACQAQFQACDSILGAGVVHPAGNWASNTQCPMGGDKRYLDASDDLVAGFSCIAKVGTAGDRRERPMDAMLAAVDPNNACNAGFLRDDAILVVTFISDDQCFEDAGNPQMWKNALVQAKGGKEDAVVVIGFVPNTDTCMHHPEACDSLGDVIDGQHWLEFVQLWGADHGLSGSVCQTEQFADIFTAAISLIEVTCQEFEPPG